MLIREPALDPAAACSRLLVPKGTGNPPGLSQGFRGAVMKERQTRDREGHLR
jgi:hypothetical protein